MAQKLNREAELIHEGQSPTNARMGTTSNAVMLTRTSSPSSSASHYSSPVTINLGLHGNIRDQATCFFIANWVLRPRQADKTRGYMDYLLTLLEQRDHPEHFTAAFEACAYASLGNRSGPGQDFKNLALARYTRALAGTHKALQDPVMSKHDNTLAAILLLGLYENISARQLGSLAWGSHIEGAIHLVKARGRKQLKTRTGLSLFIAVRTQMVGPCTRSCCPSLIDSKQLSSC